MATSSISYHSLLERLKLESSAENTRLWEKLPSFPLKAVKQPVSISHDALIVAPDKAAKFKIDALYRYRSRTAAWDAFIAYPSDVSSSSDHCAAYNASTRQLYVYARQHHVLRFDIGAHSCETLALKLRYDIRNSLSNACAVMLGGEMHMIGGLRSKYHLKLDEARRTLPIDAPLHTFRDFETGVYGQALAHVDRYLTDTTEPSQQIGVVFGMLGFHTERMRT